MDHDGDKLELDPIVLQKASSTLADRLRDQILKGAFDDGEVLPSERALMEKSGLSRATVREALRILESEGFLSTRRGAHGGSVVRRLPIEAVARSIGFLVRGQRSRMQSLFQAREVVEPACARLAALNRTDESIHQLQDATRKLEEAGSDHNAFRAGNVAWHLAVARATGNELLTAFMVALVTSLLEVTSVPLSATKREEVLRAHARITKAIVARDAEGAAKHMRAHLDAFASDKQRRRAGVHGEKKNVRQ